jgi:hypothetical protein
MGVMFKKQAELHDHLLKQERLVCNAKVIFNAVPASKHHISDIPGVVVLRTQGKVSEADAIEDVSAQVAAPAADATGVFAILIDEQVDKIYKVSVTPDVGTCTISGAITSGGRLLLNMDSNQDLSAVSVQCTIEIEYKNK